MAKPCRFKLLVMLKHLFIMMLVTSQFLWPVASQAQSFGDASAADYFKDHPVMVYTQSIQNKVEQNWHPTIDGLSSPSCTWTFVIKMDGGVSDLKIKESSKSKKFDESARAAIVSSMPFCALPKTRSRPLMIDLVFTPLDPMGLFGGWGNVLTSSIVAQSDAQGSADRDLANYLKEFGTDASARWTSCSVDDSLNSRLRMRVLKNGRIEIIETTESSGSEDFDRRLRELASNLMRSKPLPASVRESALLEVALQVEPKTEAVKSAKEILNGPFASGRDVDFGPYMVRFQRQIKKHWKPVFLSEASRVKTSFTLHHNGQITGLKVVQTTGPKLANLAALHAVESAAPFAPFPKGAPNQFEMSYTLSSEADPNLQAAITVYVSVPHSSADMRYELPSAPTEDNKLLENVTRTLKEVIP
ncbi:MAG: TonB C-terminal domain-containing protein [Candidatus Obscuribacterales bacterium]|nr:TonB C-terminal domain-containing protein [Candidatus Obscuribacterales bacterium]